MAAQEQKSGKELSHARRLQMRSVPMYPLKSGMAAAAKVKRRTRSAGQYEHVKSKVPTKENLRHKPGGGTTRIIVQRRPDYKSTAAPRIDTHTPTSYTTPRPHTSDGITSRSPTGATPYSYKPRSRDFPKIPHNDVKRFKNVKHRIDNADPTPSIRDGSHSLKELVETEGFRLNPRFHTTAVKSRSFNDVEELFESLNKEFQ